MGNLHSVHKAFQHLGAPAVIIREPQQIDAMDKIVLPGVGAFCDAMATLRELGLIEPINRAIAGGKWFLGICLGLQLLFDVSYEDGTHEGLAVIPGGVERFDFSSRSEEQQLRVPHMGWNSLRWDRDVPLFRGLDQECYVYFVHSYHVIPQDKSVIAGVTHHGLDFVSAVWRDNVMATQFHPEKSQRVGLQMLRNFAALT